MKIKFELEVFLFDYRDVEIKFCEAVILTREADMSFIPQIGMQVRIGRNDEGPSEHKVEHITWIEENNYLHVDLDNYETTIDENETDISGWGYYDSLIKDYIEKDGWEAIYHRGVRENSKWGKRID